MAATQTPVLTARPGAESGVRLTVKGMPWLLAVGLLLGWLGLWNKLRVDWTINDQYQYGWFVPPLALALLALRWPDRPAPRPGASAARGGWFALLAAACLALLLPIRLVEAPNPDWRFIFWVHAALLVTLTLAAAAWHGGWPWVRHFAFPVGFLLLAVPWPTDLEQAIVQSLMRGAATIAAELMNLLAIPADAQGNLIRVRGQLVGVDEACSGIRSLQTTVMGGCLLGELSRFRPARRLALLVGGIAFALVANVFRSSLLVWLAANYGVATLEKYHGLAGVSVLLISFAGLLWINARLARDHRPAPAVPPAAEAVDAAPTAPRPVPRAFLVAALCWLVAVEIGNVAWYHSGAPLEHSGVPRWTVLAPASAPGYQETRIDDRTARMLRYDRGLSAHWKRPAPDHPGAPADDCTLFFFRWEPGHASAAQADMHQPHICLTASGLTMTADRGVEDLPLPAGLSLPVRRYAFLWHGHPIYVFFVVWQDGVGRQDLSDTPTGRWDRLRAVADRRVNLGRQTLEFIVSGPTDAGQAEAVFTREMATAIRKL